MDEDVKSNKEISMPENCETCPENSRRNFLRRLFYLLNALGLGAIAAAIMAFLSPPRGTLKKAGGWQRVAGLSDLNKNAQMVTYFNLPVFLLRVGEDIRAFSGICPHLGCIIRWDQEKGNFPCPCHDSRFSVEGKVGGGPAWPYDLLKYKVKIEGEDIYMDTPSAEELKKYPTWFRFVIMSGG